MSLKIAFCTTCKDRTAHLAQTLPVNLLDIDGYDNAVHIVLDYNSQDDLRDFIRRERAADLRAGRLVYYRNPEPDRFRMAHAKNMAHRCGLAEGADILVNLDADNWTGRGFATYIARKFEEAAEDREVIFLGTRGNWRGHGDLARYRTPPGCSGRIVVSSDGFVEAGGYDEVFVGWTPDDKDFGARLGNLGYSWRNIRPCFLGAIDHDRERRWKGVSEDEAFELQSRAHLTIVNQGKLGCGVVHRNFDSNAIEFKRIPTRIFGIGLHLTGTTSLARALTLLGHKCAHWEKPHWASRIWNEMRSSGRSPTLEMHYALCDLPIPLLFRELDIAYPGSKFILTLRDEDNWVASAKAHWITNREGWDGDPFSNVVHEALYGTPEFDEQIFRARYRHHNEEVLKYFSGRPSDLLVMDMSKGAGWKELCGFMDQPIRSGPFPHRHRSQTGR